MSDSNVISIGNPLDVSGLRFLEEDGEPVIVVLPIGKVGVTANGAILFCDSSGVETALTGDQAMDVMHAFIRVTVAAARRAKQLSGYNSPVIHLVPCGYEATYRGESSQLRLVRFRGGHRNCDVCSERQRATIYVGQHKPMGYWLHICEACAKRLANAPRGIHAEQRSVDPIREDGR